MNNYKLTVIIPTYNTGNYLIDLFNSIKNQTIGFHNIEIIIVDDASNDKYTLNLIKELDKNYKNCKTFLLNKNSGFPGTGRNIGIKKSTSEYIIVADHDDTYQKNTFEKLYNEITQNNADVAISNFNQVYTDKIIPFKSCFKDSRIIKVKSIEEELKLLTIPAAIWTRLFRKKFLTNNNIKFLEGMLAEDVYFASLTSLKANGIIYLNDFYGYNYKIRDTEKDKSTIHIRNKKYIEAMLNGYYELVKALQYEKLEKYGEIIFKQHLTSWIHTIVLSNLTDKDKIDLFEKSYNLFNKYYTEDRYFKGKYNKIIKFIMHKQFKKATVETNKINSFPNKIYNKIKGRLNI